MEIGKVKQTEHKANRMMKIIKIETEAKKNTYMCVYIYIYIYLYIYMKSILTKTQT